ncbi:hypothetical protein EPK99_04920 [Neorhizobium lilium]|uniref:Uncharacterized protein n=1 Tax=Neorhizobium lilium TaxID=2503024 RepID=A0A3S3U4B1_9HYPH|nr:hypothetical protein [Neorhizobium lilium]RWX81615.1 hypothetical protein EPK99_04920 [Neorhizobium lilium]
MTSLTFASRSACSKTGGPEWVRDVSWRSPALNGSYFIPGFQDRMVCAPPLLAISESKQLP